MLIRCKSPDCGDPPAENDRFCTFHREVFTRVREELELGKAQRRMRRTVFKSCAFSDCPDAAKPGTEHCLHHLRMLGRL